MAVVAHVTAYIRGKCDFGQILMPSYSPSHAMSLTRTRMSYNTDVRYRKSNTSNGKNALLHDDDLHNGGMLQSHHDKFKMRRGKFLGLPASDWRVLGALFLIAVAVRTFRIHQPSNVV